MDPQKQNQRQQLETIQEDEEFTEFQNGEEEEDGEFKELTEQVITPEDESVEHEEKRQRLDTIQEDEEFAEFQNGEEEEEDREFEELTEQVMTPEKESVEHEEEVCTPLKVRRSRTNSSARQEQSRSAPPMSEKSLYDFRIKNPSCKPTGVRRKRQSRGGKVRCQEDLFPEWVVKLMFNIEEATTHQLVVE